MDRRPLTADRDCDHVDPGDIEPVRVNSPANTEPLVIVDGIERVAPVRRGLDLDSDDHGTVRHDEVEFVAVHTSVTFDQPIATLDEKSLRQGFTEGTDLVS